MKQRTFTIIMIVIVTMLVLFIGFFVHSYKAYDFENPCQIKCNGFETKEYCYSGGDTCVNVCLGTVDNPCE